MEYGSRDLRYVPGRRARPLTLQLCPQASITVTFPAVGLVDRVTQRWRGDYSNADRPGGDQYLPGTRCFKLYKANLFLKPNSFPKNMVITCV